MFVTDELSYRLLAAKLLSYPIIESTAQIVLQISRESKMHKEFCAQWGISEEELENTPESPATMAYGAYLIDAGLQGEEYPFHPRECICFFNFWPQAIL